MKNLLKYGVTSVVIEPSDVEFIRDRGLSASRMLRNYIQGLKMSEGKTMPELLSDKMRIAEKLSEALRYIDLRGNTDDFWEWQQARRIEQKNLRAYAPSDATRNSTGIIKD